MNPKKLWLYFQEVAMPSNHLNYFVISIFLRYCTIQKDHIMEVPENLSLIEVIIILLAD